MFTILLVCIKVDAQTISSLKIHIMKILQNSLKAITATLLLSSIALISYSQSGLVGQWHLDGNTNDETGGHNGTIVGTVTQVTGQCNQGYRFNGSSYINCG